MKNHPQRKSPRLQGYDYSQSGAYYVTICTHQRDHTFGTKNEEMYLSNAGTIASKRWHGIPKHYLDVELDAFVVMPNHIHGIIVLTGDSNFKTYLGRIINAYKGAVTARIRKMADAEIVVWQSRYHDRIVRNERELNAIRQYILYNPVSWAKDEFYTS